MANFLKSLFIKGVEIDTASAITGNSLIYNGTKFAPATPGTGSIALDNLSDVVITTPEDFQGISYNGTNWVNGYQPVVSYVRNAEATTITTGTCVYLFGATGDHATVKRADKTSDTTSAKTVGVVGANITASGNGPVVTRGYVDGIDLSTGYTAGDILWLGDDGAFTTTKATAPDHLVFIGVVVRATNNGIIYVATQNGYELDELHNVSLPSPQSGEFLKYNGSLWVADAINLGTDTTGNYMSGISGTSPVSVAHTAGEGSSATVSLAASYGDTQNPYASKTANYVLASPNGSAGVPTFRALVATDVPTLNQNTTGTASNITASSNTTLTSLANLTTVGTLTGLTVTGRLGVGAVLTSGAMAQITNTTAADKAFIVKGAASQSGDFIDVQNSGGTSQFKVDSSSRVGVNASTSAGTQLIVGGTTDASALGSGVAAGQTLSSTMLDYRGFWSLPAIPAGSNTYTQIFHFHANPFAIGAGSTLTTGAGFVASSSLGSNFSGTVTNAYGFWGNLASGTNRYNLYMGGTAQNYLAGNLGIGTTTPDTALDVIGTTTLKTVKAGSGAVNISAASYVSLYGTTNYSTTTPHGFATGDTVAVTGITPSSWNRTATITVANSTQFFFSLFNGSTGGAYSSGGTATGPPSTLYVDTTNDRIGIGTSSPATKLDVVGTITATTYTGALASAVTATTQAVADNSTKVATTAFVIANAGSMSQIDAQTFSSSTTYTIPASSKLIVVECIGAGGGGGSGRKGLAAQTGGGGAGGAWERISIPVSELGGVGASVTVTIGAGGAGGAAIAAGAADGTAGNMGSKGGNSRFGTFYFSGAVSGGGGSSGGSGERGQGYVGGLAMTVGSEFGTGGRAALVARKGWRGGGGGGAGGYAGASSESDPPLTTGSQFYAATTGGGGAAGTGDGGNGTAGGTSQGGGGGANGSAVKAGDGGNGGAAGGGGGGGGGSATSVTFGSGAGGTGGNAQIKIWVFG